LGLGRFFISADTARSWIQLDSEFGDHIINDLDTDIAHPDTFYAATDDGVYKLKNPVWPRKPITPLTSQTWGPGIVIVNGDVVIPQGVTLTIAPGTTIEVVYDFDKDRTGSSLTKSEIVVYGSLIADDAGNQANPVVFESSHPSAPTAGQWYGIRVENLGEVRLDYCQIRHAEYGIRGNGYTNIIVNHTRFEQCATAGIYLTNALTASVQNSRLVNCGTYGIYGYESSYIATFDTIENCKYGTYYKGAA
jgi:hypothetical protein